MISYCQVSAFTSTPGHGNSAGVVLDGASLSDTQMQGLAARLGVPETVFVVNVDGRVARVRFFTPTQEIEFCGHATVALGLVLAQRGLWRDGMVLETLVGPIELDLEREAGAPHRVWMRQRPLEVRRLPSTWRSRLAGALGVSDRLVHRGLPLAVASTGLWSVFVPLLDAFVVDALEPNFAEVEAISRELGVTGVHAYAPMSPDSFYTRDFAPLVGIPEDPVTGSSSGALVALLAGAGVLPRRGGVARGVCRQGHALGTPGEVVVDVVLDGVAVREVRVGGCAVVEREGRL